MGRMERFQRNLRFALRSFLGRPGFAVLAVLTMAVGIGANVAIFSVVKTVLLDPLPYHDSDRLLAIFEWKQPREENTNVANPGNVLAWREGASSLSGLSVVSLQLPATVTSRGEPAEAMVQYAHPDFFQTLGLDAEVGRTFLVDAPEAVEGEVVLSHQYWEERFGGSPDVLGSSLEINGDVVEVVGVLPPVYVAFGEGTALWMSIDAFRGDQTNSGRWLWPVGRLGPQSTFEQARDELEAVAAGLQAEFPEFNGGWTVNPVPLKDHVVGDIRGVLWILMGAVGLLLLIASVNVANLFLIRATERQKEMAVRTSMGASASTLAGQLLTEALLVAGSGAALGVILAQVGTRIMAARLPAAFALPRVESAGVDGTVLLAAVGLTVLTGLLFGLVPALQGARTHPASVLNAESRGPSRRTGRLRNGLVVAEVALSLVLLSGAALLGRSLLNLLAVDPGIEPEQVLAGRVNLSGGAYEEEPAMVAFFQELTEALEARPEVTVAGGITFLPMDGLGAGTSFYPMDRPPPPPDERRAADIRNVVGDYFGAMGIDLLEGRTFDNRDGPDGPRTVVVNRTTAETHWPGESAIGKPLYISWETDEPWEIVGVVDDVRLGGLDQEPRETIYLHYPRTPYFDFVHVVTRARGNPTELASILREEVRAMDSSLPVGRIRVMSELVKASAARPRMTAFLMFLFAGLATILAAVGLYGVLAYAVSRRVKEIGIRIAVGARPRDILGMVLRQGGLLALAGLAVGGAVALAGGRVVDSLLYEIQPADPLALGASGGVLFLVALLASALPAWRAARVAPSDSLREE
jgi:putative ABC transport system permease protein